MRGGGGRFYVPGENFLKWINEHGMLFLSIAVCLWIATVIWMKVSGSARPVLWVAIAWTASPILLVVWAVFYAVLFW
jgi:hypothetical protein